MRVNWKWGVLLVLVIIFSNVPLAMGQESLFKDYNVLVVSAFSVPPNTPAPESSGPMAAEKIVYQVRRYSQKYNLFDIIITEGKQEIPPGKKVLLVKGEVKEYIQPTVGRRIGRSFIPGGEYTGTAAFAARYQFVDKDSGKVIYETDLRTTSTGANDSVEYAMERNGEAAAKLITKYKGK